MFATIHCSNCNYESSLFGQFCSNCGHALTSSCRVCGEDNVIPAKFCRTCGVELTSASVGLLLDRAMAWREQFRKMGWWEWYSDFKEDHWNLIKSQNVPTDVNERHEPWVFGCVADGKTMKPEHLYVNAKDFGTTGTFGYTNPFVVATRCRIGIFNPKLKTAQVWSYTDLKEYQYSGGDVTIGTHKGDKIRMLLKVPTAGLLDVATALAATDPVARGFVTG